PTAWHARRQADGETRVLTGADLVLAASRTHADALAARAHDRPRRLLHLPNGFEPVAPPARTTVADPSAFRVVYTGSLSLMEDAGTLLDAVGALLAREPAARARLRVTLAGPHDNEWPAKAARLGIADVVSLPGPLAHAETRALQRAADLLILWKPRGAG